MVLPMSFRGHVRPSVMLVVFSILFLLMATMLHAAPSLSDSSCEDLAETLSSSPPVKIGSPLRSEHGHSFGNSVSVSNNLLLIGAPGDYNIPYAGAAYLFFMDAGDKTTPPVAHQLNASDGVANDQFGRSVALSGNLALVGAPYREQYRGAAYLFSIDVASKTATQVTTLKATDPAESDQFGCSVALSGSLALVGAFGNSNHSGLAYVFVIHKAGRTGTQIAKLKPPDLLSSAYFGSSVALDGNIAVVGVIFGDMSGSVYVFVINSEKTAATQVATLKASDGASSDGFGCSVALYGNLILVGAYNSDNNGTRSGSMYAFSIDAVSMRATEVVKFTASDDVVSFGHSVALFGTMALVGAVRQEYVTAYAFSIDVYQKKATQVAELSASGSGKSEAFGASVALHGTLALVGAHGLNNSRDAAYLYVGCNGEAATPAATGAIVGAVFGVIILIAVVAIFVLRARRDSLPVWSYTTVDMFVSVDDDEGDFDRPLTSASVQQQHKHGSAFQARAKWSSTSARSAVSTIFGAAGWAVE